jgi:ATP-dependent helicase Lhr and Lhr-like helicase
MIARTSKTASKSNTSKDKDAASKLVDQFFRKAGWKPFDFQKQVWNAYVDGASGLVHSATGTGKTLAIWMAPILKWLQENPDPAAWQKLKTPAPRTLWITPLRALAGDTENALRRPLDDLQLPWTLASRTGDTSSSQKSKLLRKLPTALITTPESLCLMLSHERLATQLGSLESVMVDEWHELLGTKRGVQTELALARLRKLNPQLQTWGVSATLGNLDQALESLLGVAHQGPSTIIQGYKNKKLKIESLLPETIERFPWSGHIGSHMVPQVCQRIEQADSCLVFANTRSQTEIWYQKMLAQRKDWAGQLALHHGSLDHSVRNWVEDALRAGKLRAVVCTSSLDLGVDFTAVDLVIQVGSPKGAARLLQRAGRSGHQPNATSQLAFVPTHALELVELAAAQDAITNNELEARLLLDKPLDVLIQHAVTMAIAGGFRREELLAEVRTTRAYESLTDQEWDWVLDFIVRGGSSLEVYPEFRRVQKFADLYTVVEKRIASRHRMSIGTITADAAMQVKYLKGATLGTVEESFLSKVNPGEKFLFAGRVVELVRIRDNAAYVKKAKGTPDAIPRWMGGRMPMSSELSYALRRRLDQAAQGDFSGREMKSLRPLLELQARWSLLPRLHQFLIERIQTRDGHQIFLYPFEGRLVHEGLAAVLAYRLSQIAPITISMACNDYGIVLQSRDMIPLDLATERGLFSTEALEDHIFRGLNGTEMRKRQFRSIARVAGLIQQGYPGQQRSAKQLQASSNLFFDVFQEFDPDNLLMQQATREVLQQQLEAGRMEAGLKRITSNEIIIKDPPKVTPMAFPLLVDKLRERLSSETLEQRIQKLQQQLEKAAGK